MHPFVKILICLFCIAGMNEPEGSGALLDMARNFEAMSMASGFTSVTSEDIPPPPPPLELERWQTLSKSGYYGASPGKRGIFSRNFLGNNSNSRDEMRARDAGRYSRESSVTSDRSSDLGSSVSLSSIVSRSSTLSRLFSRARRRYSRTRSVSLDDDGDVDCDFISGSRVTSTPATPTPYGTWRGRGRYSREKRECPGTPSISQKIRQALNNSEKRPVGKFILRLTQPSFTKYAKRNFTCKTKI